MIRSMTGFAQLAGTSGTTRWSWEFKTLNGKGLDLRLRLPPGFDMLEIACRKSAGVRLARGTCQIALTISRDAAAPPRINTELLQALAQALADTPMPPSIGPATLDGLLGLRGVIETGDAVLGDQSALQEDCAEGFMRGLDGLVAMRETEGRVLRDVLESRLRRIAALTREADDAPQRQPEAARARLARNVAALVAQPGLDAARLHQEALLIAAKADVREELDRLAAHTEAACGLMAIGGAVGRRLDFLAQELGREASTFCAKVNDAALTAIGLELRVEIEQFREQVQNIE